MTKFDIVLKRLQDLPADRRDAIAEEIDVLLDDETAGASVLTDEQWAEVEVALADENEPVAVHREVFARLGSRTAE